MTDKVSFQLPDDKSLAKKVIEAENLKIDQGKLGAFFGGKSNAPINIAGFVAIMALAMVLGVFFLPDHQDIPKREIVIALIGLASSTIGYLFGRGGD